MKYILYIILYNLKIIKNTLNLLINKPLFISI
ncbi:hypothetical protein SAMN05421788_113127 [Filimonas lacunae]|uniref:Uncharacterized protein n=1 Tax=Filimonas lacunae TaxID=477680 RepID=A0A1N7RF75_9BACT|nr:hypothetical protein SAMN05421788_113127 [Filimonas lacunae]